MQQHLERLDRMESIKNQMWPNYWHAYEKVKILSEIANIQPIVSAYHDATKGLLEER